MKERKRSFKTIKRQEQKNNWYIRHMTIVELFDTTVLHFYAKKR